MNEHSRIDNAGLLSLPASFWSQFIEILGNPLKCIKIEIGRIVRFLKNRSQGLDRRLCRKSGQRRNSAINCARTGTNTFHISCRSHTAGGVTVKLHRHVGFIDERSHKSFGCNRSKNPCHILNTKRIDTQFNLFDRQLDIFLDRVNRGNCV